MAAPPFWQGEGDATPPAGYSPATRENCRATNVSMKKSRDYPLCGGRESRYNDPGDMGRRVATVMTPQRMSCQGVMSSAGFCGNQCGNQAGGDQEARRKPLQYNHLRA